jgi:hypothetical protein
MSHRACQNVSFRSPHLFYLLTVVVSRLFIFTCSHSDTHTTVGRTPLDEGSAHRRDLYLTTQTLTRDKYPCHRWDSNPRFQKAPGRRPTPETARPLESAFQNVLKSKYFFHLLGIEPQLLGRPVLSLAASLTIPYILLGHCEFSLPPSVKNKVISSTDLR